MSFSGPFGFLALVFLLAAGVVSLVVVVSVAPLVPRSVFFRPCRPLSSGRSSVALAARVARLPGVAVPAGARFCVRPSSRGWVVRVLPPVVPAPVRPFAGSFSLSSFGG